MRRNVRTPWRAVAAMFVLNGALFGIWASRIPAVAEWHALSHGALGWLLLLLAGGAIVSFPLAGRLADRLGAATVTRAIAVAYVTSLLLIALAPTLPLLAAALFLFGMTHGAMDVTMNVWAAEVERHMARPVMSSFHAMFSLGAGIGAYTGYLAAAQGVDPSVHFALAGIGSAALTLPLAWIGWTSERRSDAGASIFALPRGTLLLVGIIAFCSSLGEGAMADWSALFILETTTATEARAALGYTAFSLAMVIVRLTGDHAIRALGPVRAAQLAGITAAIGVALAMFGGVFVTALAGFVLIGAGYAVIMPLAFSRTANDPVMSPGAALAAVSTLGYGGLLLGPPVIGFLAEASSIRAAFGVLALLACVIAALSPAMSR